MIPRQKCLTISYSLLALAIWTFLAKLRASKAGTLSLGLSTMYPQHLLQSLACNRCSGNVYTLINHILALNLADL